MRTTTSSITAHLAGLNVLKSKIKPIKESANKTAMGLKKRPSTADTEFIQMSAIIHTRKLSVVIFRTKKNSITSPNPIAHNENNCKE